MIAQSAQQGSPDPFGLLYPGLARRIRYSLSFLI
jgi:hypothetical protein